ncbi:MAG: hypothetical protein WC501_03795 [Candidatus Micrarchaeia archaeon]
MNKAFFIVLFGVILLFGCTQKPTEAIKTYECPNGEIVEDMSGCSSDIKFKDDEKESELESLENELNSKVEELDTAFNNQDFDKAKSTIPVIKSKIDEIKDLGDASINERYDMCVIKILNSYENYIYFKERLNKDSTLIFSQFTLSQCKDLEDIAIDNLAKCKEIEGANPSFAKNIQDSISFNCYGMKILQDYNLVSVNLQTKDNNAKVYANNGDYIQAKIIYEDISRDILKSRDSFNQLCEEISSSSIISQNKKTYFESSCSNRLDYLNELSLFYLDLADVFYIIDLLDKDMLNYERCNIVVNNLNLRKNNMELIEKKETDLGSVSTTILNVKIVTENMCNTLK